MTVDEIISRVELSPGHSLVISRVLLDAPVGYVRVVEIRDGCRVCVAVEPYGFDDSGFYFWGQYGDWTSLISDLQIYLKLQITKWSDVDSDRYYPDRPNDMEVCHYEVAKQVATGGMIHLPSGGNFALVNSPLS